MDVMRRVRLVPVISLGIVGAVSTAGVLAGSSNPLRRIFAAHTRRIYSALFALVLIVVSGMASAGNSNTPQPDSDPDNSGPWNWCAQFASPSANGGGGTCTWVPGGQLATPATRTLYAFQPYGSVCNLGNAPGLYTACEGLGGPYTDAWAVAGSGLLTDGGEGDNDGGCSCSGQQNGGLNVGDPINVWTGNKYTQEDDYKATAWLTFRRFYNSQNAIAAHLGSNWRSSFDRAVQVSQNVNGAPFIQASRPDGKQIEFTKNNGVWSTYPITADQLVETDNSQRQATGYTLFVAATRHFENYDANGVLQSILDETGQGDTLTYSTASTPTTVAPSAGLLLVVSDPQGRQLSFTYDSSARVSTVTLPDGGSLTYSYDAAGNLSTVQYPDGNKRQYVYNESSLTGNTNLPHAMTGIVDEASARYASTSYDSNGLATSSGFAGNVGTVQLTYDVIYGKRAVQYPLGVSVSVGFSSANMAVLVGSNSQACGVRCGQSWKTQTYDTNGYPASHTDFNGNVTKTTFDANDLLDQQIDASGTSNQRTTNFTWNTTLRVPLTRTVLGANGNTISATQWIYNNMGQVLARCDIDPASSAATGYTCSNAGTVPAGVRRSTYTYCTAVDTTQCPIVGLMLTATGPRTDTTQTTTYNYYLASSATNCGTPGAACYQSGDLHTITDPQGHVITIASYDADGRITRLTDANGINTDLTYMPRGWLASRSVGGATTSFTYTPYGAVQTVTDPDSVTTTYGYDTAHRLVKITDAQGNYVQYTLDAAGNKTAEQTYDSSGTLHKSLTRSFNTLGQLTKVTDGLSHTVFDASASGSYDTNGNLVQSTDGLGIQRQLGYDALNRLVQTLDNYNGTN